MTLFWCANGPAPFTAAYAPVTTGTAIKTMLQVATSSTRKIKVVKWGVQFASAPVTPITVELIQTDVPATVTAHVAAGVMAYSDSDSGGVLASSVPLGTALTGYTASAEGTTAASRVGDYVLLGPGNSYVWEWSLGREFDVAVSKFLRVRVTAGTAVNMFTYVVWDE